MSEAPMHDWWISPEEYLAAEELAETKHEYSGGRVCALHGLEEGTARGLNAHSLVCVNLIAELRNRLRGTPFRPFNSDTAVRVHSWERLRHYHADCLVAERQNPLSDVFQDEPKVVFEVVSPATERIDYDEKQPAYCSLPSMEVYALVESEHFGLTVYRRTAEGWKMELLKAREAVLGLPEIGCSLPLSTIYEDSGL